MLVTGVLWTAFFLVNFNIAMMIPLLPFIGAAVGLTAGQAGWVLAAFPVVALGANLLLGPWIDRLGRRRFIVAGAGCCAALFGLTALADDPAVLILCRAATGLFMPMLGASVFAAVADYVPAARRVRVAGLVTTAAPVAFLLSMGLGVVLGGLVSWRVPLLLVAGLAAGLAVAALRLPPTPAAGLAAHPVTARTYRERLSALSTSRDTRRLFIGYFCWSAAVFTFLGFYPTWLVQRGLAGQGPGGIGVLLLLGELGGLGGALFSGRLARSSGRPLRLCAGAAALTALVVAVVPFGAGAPAVQGLAYFGFAFGRDLMLALILGGAMLLVPAAQRGSLNAVMNAIYQTGATLGGLVSAGLYAARPDFGGNATAAALLLLVTAASLWRIGRAE